MITKNLTIRPFEESDDKAISNYCLPSEQAIFTSLPTFVVETFREDSFNQPYMIFSGEDLVGCFVLYCDKSGNIYTENESAILLKSFSIDSRHQKKGYALQSLQSLPDLVKNHFPDKDEILLTVHNMNIPAINLYKKAGFLDKGLAYEGEYGTELIYHYELGAHLKEFLNV
ncbi:GNAT family protein [Bacillus sp. NEB1478]|uniref:GNAT family N-acetyltransferase n=1 Tax=Bacillus sp. NEB1478 TaxID=3073816 RepID=UPI002873D695|nr:GNAT family protein [Bacillus sp. NEB1478]WNB91139.1 GNAT family protein [Bacillus sp. NEB1478]